MPRQRFRRRPGRRLPDLTVEDILSWADAFEASVGRWPTRSDGKVAGQLGLTWCGVNQALQKGRRGLPGGSSLPKLLRDERGRRHKGLLPLLSVTEILAWIDAFHERADDWPTCCSGKIPEAPGETWLAVDKALRKGSRGLTGNSSLAQLLDSQRGVRNPQDLPPLTVDQVLAWADAHQASTGDWPKDTSGAIPGSGGETWGGVHAALCQGIRGLLADSSLPRLLAAHRGIRNDKNLPPLDVEKILDWADAYHEETGRWPRHTSGDIPGAGGETWGGVHTALYRGGRGMPGGSSLFKLLAARRGITLRRRRRVLVEA